MKITETRLKQIIKEELVSVVSEGFLDKFLKRRKIKKQGGYEWDDFSPEQKDSLRRAMDSEDPDMAKADLEISKKQAREKVQTDLENFKKQRDAKRKAEEEARRKTQARVKLLQDMSDYAYKELPGLVWLAVLIAGGGFFLSALSDANEKLEQTRADREKTQRMRKQRHHLDRVAWEKRINPIAIEVEKMSKEEIYEQIKYIRPKHSKPIPEFHKRAVAKQISDMSVIEIEQMLKDEWTMKKAFKRFEINPAEDLKIKKDDSIYK